MKRRAAYYGIYTLVFAALAYHIFYVFYENGRSFIWDKDGLYQTYASMVYISEYWKEFLRNLWENHEFVLPMTDLRIGLGSDVMTTLNHYGFGDPLLLLSVPVKPENMEALYAFLAVLRYYLAGVSFSVYCFYMKRREFPTLIGALAYAFCGYALYAGVRHPYFLNSMWYFPLMLVGVEQVLKRKRGTVLTFVTALAACSNFYFLYLLTILTFLYAMVRFSCRRRNRNRETFAYILSRGCGYYFLGLGLGAAFLIPNILAFLGNARGGIKETGTASLLHYGADFYGQLIRGMMLPEFSADYWTVLSLVPMAAFGCVLMFTVRDRQHSWTRVLFVILTAILCVPAGGLALNGFSYVSNRWIYGYVFLMCYMMVRSLEILPAVSLKRILWPGAVLLAAGAAAWRAGMLSEGPAARGLWLAAVNFLLLILCAVFSRVWKEQRLWQRWGLYGVYGGVFFISLGAILGNARFLYSPEYGDYVSEFHPRGQALAILEQGAETQAAAAGAGIFRVDGDSINVVNNSMVCGFNGTGGFFSIVSDDIFQYMKALEVDDVKFPNWYYGFGDRAALNTLASVKYYGNNYGTDLSVPYGYVPAGGAVYENTLALPIAYTYDKVLDGMEFMTLPAVRKQEAMMQAVYLDGIENESSLPSGIKKSEARELSFEITELPWTIDSMENMQWDQETGELIVYEGGGDLYLEFDGRENAETYLRFGNYDINGSGYELLTVNVECGDAFWKKFYEASTMSVWYGDLHNFIVNLGWRREARNRVHINFPFYGTFKLDGLQIYSVPMESYERHMRERQNGAMQDARMEGNRITGTVAAERPQMLLFSIPYSTGWRARVDGETAKIYKANLMYMAVPLEAGEHVVEISYRTPGFWPGILVTAFSAFWLAIFLTAGAGKKKRKFAYTNKYRIYETIGKASKK